MPERPAPGMRPLDIEGTPALKATEPVVARVLVVDDEPKLADILANMLRAQTFQVTACSSGAEALEALKAQDFHLLLCDLMMPGMNGIEVLRAGIEIDPNLVGIIMTGQGTVQTAVDAMKIGAFDYVLKPFKLQSLLPVIHRALELRRLRLENLQLHDTLAIYELGQTVAYSLDSTQILEKTADAAMQQCDAEEVSIMLPTSEGELYVAVARGERRDHLIGHRVSIAGGIAGWVARNRQSLTPTGLATEPGFAPFNPEDLPSAISYPLLSGGRLVAVLNAATKRPRGFTLGQVKAVGILAAMAAAALENAELYAQVHRAEAQYRLISENAADLIAVLDLDGRRIYSSPSHQELFGDPDALRGVGFLADVHLDDRDRVGRVLQEALGTGNRQCAEYRLLALDGTVHATELQASLVRDEEGKPKNLVLVSRDVSERKGLEERLTQVQKMEALGQLAGGIAHDFNNLLTITLGFSTVLLARMDADDPLRSHVEEIQRAAERGASLTSQLLAFSRRRVLNPEVIDLNGVVAGMENLLRRVLGEDIQVVAELAPDLGTTRADRNSVEQVILNLASNARDAMPQGGQLTLATRNVDLDEHYVDLHPSVRPGPYVLLAVADTGVGVNAETQRRIFEPFFTTKEPGQGTGLGLATVYGIVQQSEGTISVYSEPAQGTTFKVYLPRLDGPVPLAEPSALPPEAVGGTETILVAEDEDSIRGLIQQILQAHGYTVIAAATGQEALQLSKQHPGSIDLLITDIIMPGTRGGRLAHRLVALRPTTRVLFVSGHPGRTVPHELRQAEAPFLEKPFTPDELLRRVRETLEGAPPAPAPPGPGSGGRGRRSRQTGTDGNQ